MKFKGKKANVKSVGFRILQEDDGLDGLRGKDGFKRSQVVSPLFGSDVKDTFVVNDIATSSNSVDVRKNYDYARKTKKISESELIEKYGTKYYEFQMITSDTRRAVYGDDITIGNNKNAAKKNFDEEKEFGFIKKADDILDNQPNVENDEIKSFDFDQFKEVTPNNSVDIDMSFGEFKPRYDSGERNTYSKPTNEENLGFLNPKTESAVKPAPSIPDYVNINSSHEVSDFNGPMPRENDNKPLKSSFDMPKIVSPYKDYKLPPFNIFKKGSASDTTMPEWLEEKKEIINQTLVDFGVPGEVIRSVKGPTFSRYEVSLQAGVPVKKVSNLYDNLQMNL